MAVQPTVWGVHMGWHVNNRPIDGGYVAIIAELKALEQEIAEGLDDLEAML